MNQLTVTSIEPKDGLKTSHRKENGFDRAFIAIDKKGEVICELRTYWPANNCYACFWIHYAGIYANGSGSAGGYGYDKRSSAASAAVRSAGVQMSSFGASGRTREAVEAIGRKLAKRQFLTVIEVNA